MTGVLSGSTRGEIHRIVERHRRALLRLERGAASEMVRVYGGIWQRLQRELNSLLEEYNAALEANGEISPSWVYEHDRLHNLQRQVEAELRRFADYAEARIVANERAAVQAASRHFQEILTTTARGQRGIVGVWDRLPVPAVEDLVGFTANGSPLRVLLDELGPAASEAVRSGLVEGLALGQNPRAIARRIRQDFGGDLVRALRISRTETLRSYREATRRNYQESGLVSGWRWLSAKQPRTCAMCLAMDGTFHTLDEHLDDHPNGRCAMVPCLKGDENAPPGWEMGSTWLAKQSEAVQRQVLGNAGYEAYRAGAVTLTDFVGQKQSREWGTTRYARSLMEIVGAEAAKDWRQPATIAQVPWKDWNPHRADTHLVGQCGDQLRDLIGKLAGVRSVYVSEETVRHYVEKHSSQFDVARAEGMLSQLIADPLFVYQGRKKSSLLFIGSFDEGHYLVAPIKTLPGELWQESLYIDEIEKFRRRKWVQEGLLYNKIK